MATTKLSVTVDADVLAEIKRLAGAGANVSFLVNEALRRESKRLSLLDLLEEMQREKPPTPDEKAEGERIWQEMLSSTPEPSRRSRTTNRRRSKP